MFTSLYIQIIPTINISLFKQFYMSRVCCRRKICSCSSYEVDSRDIRPQKKIMQSYKIKSDVYKIKKGFYFKRSFLLVLCQI